VNLTNEIAVNITEAEYRQNYVKNMLAIYNDIHQDLFHHCTGLSYPLDTSDPPECWPAPVILPSYPTGGNGLFRSMLSNLTDPLEMSMVMYNNSKQLPTGLFRLGPNEDSMLIYGSLSQGHALPLFRRVVVFKSHMGGSNPDNPKQAMNAQKLHRAWDHEKLNGILRLARNPGDHILRNHFRWSQRHCYKQGYECFQRKAKRASCPAMSEIAADYSNFHTFWNEFDKNIPQSIAYYEHFTNKAHAADSMIAALKFLNNLTPDVDYERFYKDTDRIAKVTDVIKEPKYAHGKLLAEICGKDIAREVHEKTKSVTKHLGYVFDEDSGTWSLDTTII